MSHEKNEVSMVISRSVNQNVIKNNFLLNVACLINCIA